MVARIVVGVVLAVLSAAYGVVIKAVGDGTRFFLVWFALAAAILITALLPVFQNAAKSPGLSRLWHVVRICTRVCWGLVIFLVAVTWGCVATQFGAQGAPNLDYVVVLGAQVYDNGPSVVLKYRLDTAYDYLESNPNTTCIVSGGQGWNEPAPEATIMKRYLVGRGIDEGRIVEEPDSLNTSGNIANSKRLIAEREGVDPDGALPDSVTVGIVTNNFHVFRARALARHAGISGAQGIAAPIEALYLPNNMLRETGGIVKDLLVGNI